MFDKNETYCIDCNADPCVSSGKALLRHVVAVRKTMVDFSFFHKGVITWTIGDSQVSNVVHFPMRPVTRECQYAEMKDMWYEVLTTSLKQAFEDLDVSEVEKDVPLFELYAKALLCCRLRDCQVAGSHQINMFVKSNNLLISSSSGKSIRMRVTEYSNKAVIKAINHLTCDNYDNTWLFDVEIVYQLLGNRDLT